MGAFYFRDRAGSYALYDGREFQPVNVYRDYKMMARKPRVRAVFGPCYTGIRDEDTTRLSHLVRAAYLVRVKPRETRP